ncbi:DMT family transporter [Chakrabartia godavariana]|nr:DMT family transporter [Chakrabartia godavariana]
MPGHGDQHAHHAQGLLFALGGYMLLSMGDAVVKSMVPLWPAPAIAALRYLLGAAGLGVLLWVREGRGGFAIANPWLHWGRAAAVAVSSVCFFIGVKLMPLGDATAITFIGPMLTALLSALFLGERATRATLLASVVAFAGVLIVLRPNVAEAGWAALFPLGSALGMSILILLNRKAAGTASVLALQFSIAAFATPLLIAAAIGGDLSGLRGFDVHWPHWSVILRCAIVAVSASCAHALIFLATTRASAATIAPMTYVQLIVAMTIGALVFGDVPDATSLVGSALIVGAGLFLWRSAAPKRA